MIDKMLCNACVGSTMNAANLILIRDHYNKQSTQIRLFGNQAVELMKITVESGDYIDINNVSYCGVYADVLIDGNGYCLTHSLHVLNSTVGTPRR